MIFAIHFKTNKDGYFVPLATDENAEWAVGDADCQLDNKRTNTDSNTVVEWRREIILSPSVTFVLAM